jgi:hypothetical protein
MCNLSEVILEEGIEKGRREERIKAIRNMLKFGISKETIATFYPLELVEQIICEQKTEK